MKLPGISAASGKTQRQTVQFYGLNISENRKEGELADSMGLTTDNYPVITQRKCRKSLGAYTRPTSIFSWGGLIVVDGTRLIYKGQVVGNVTEGEKQFAVVNTKLCIFPDKVFLDLNDLAVRPLEPRFRVSANTATFTEHGITISSSAPVISADTSSYPFSSGSPKYVKTYTALAWDSDTQTWTKTGEQEKLVQDVADGDLLIPSVSDAGVATINVKESGTWSGTENDIGIYAKITGHSKSSVTTERQWEKFNCVSSYYTYYTKTRIASHLVDSYVPDWLYDLGSTWTVDYYTGQVKRTGVVSILLKNGVGMYTPEGKRITSVNQSDQSFYYDQYDAVQDSGISYSKGSTSYGLVRGAPGTYPNNDRAADGYWYVDRGETGFDGTETLNFDLCDASGANGIFTNYFSVGDRLTISGATTFPENNTPEGKTATVVSVSEYSITFDDQTVFTTGSEAGAMELVRPIPDMDYICSSNNRLWGVSNADKTIYASALGKPENFNVFEGVDTDSYAVPVGSDDDFTGIIGYGNAVLCWKENTLHKIMGDNPSEYYMSTYTVNGVQDGSFLSMQVINEVLYYKGIDGVYAYTGGTPTLISTELGDHRYQYAVAGSDDLHYYISMQRQDESAWVLCVYDILRGLWIKEDERRCNSFTELDNHVLFLSDSQIWQTGQEDGEVIDWMAEFVPFTEDTFSRKIYTRLLVRMELDKGSVVYADVKLDNGHWRQVQRIQATSSLTVDIPVRVGRCDRFSVRLRGTGKSVIRTMAREFRTESEV